MEQSGRKILLGALMALLLGAMPAHASGHHDWARTAQLHPGERIAIYREQQEYPDACDFVSADADALTCTTVGPDEPAQPTRRLVFPRTTVREVWAFDPQRGWDVATWIKAGFFTALAGAAIACIAINPLCLLPALAVGAALLEPSPIPPPFLLPRATGPRIRRRLVYRTTARFVTP